MERRGEERKGEVTCGHFGVLERGGGILVCCMYVSMYVCMYVCTCKDGRNRGRWILCVM